MSAALGAKSEPVEIEAPLPIRTLYALRKFANRHASFLTLAALTNQVWKSKVRHGSRGEIPGNGLQEAGAIVRIAGRVLIDEARYFAWVDAQQAHRGTA